jgi:two-component SAPR family response regulator
MRRLIHCIAIVLLVHFNCFAQTYGLTFNSHEAVLERRTSLDLSPDDSLCFSKEFDLSFDISLLPKHLTYFGYVLRIISGNDQNIDLIYDQKTSLFKVIVGEKFSGISFQIDSFKLYNAWSRLNLSFNLEKNTLTCLANGKAAGSCYLNLKYPCFKFLWGANDFQKFKSRDLPPMQIKNIRISEQQKDKYFWPLDEVKGEDCVDKISGRVAKVKNPGWIKPKHQAWEQVAAFTVKGYSGVAFDAKKDKIYVTGSDSLMVYTLLDDPPVIEFISNVHQNLLMGHQSVYDSTSDKLYDVYADQQKVVPFDFGSTRWKENFSANAPLTEFWHANKFISVADSSLYIMAGYGQLHYRNQVFRYRLPNKTWEQITVQGDSFPPRYLAALGASPDGKYAYIIGGYGSHTGDQMLDPTYYYDLYRYDIGRRSFKKLFNIKSPVSQFTFANSLVIDPESKRYYALMFPNDLYNSHLQLISGSLEDSTFQTLGNPIEYNFQDIKSYADLFYSPVSNKLIAITLLFSKFETKEQSTQVKIYTIDFPPEGLPVTTELPQKTHSVFLILGIFAVIALSAVYYFIRSKSDNKKMGAPVVSAPEENVMAIRDFNVPNNYDNERNIHSSIFLFGQFQIIDKDGNDITRLFTPLLKELFLIIAIYSVRNGRGISSEGLNEILWHDKSEKDAKNNRSVNLAKLKIILEKVGNCMISKEAGFWQFQIADPDMNVDYAKYMAIINSGAEPSKETVDPFLHIIKRGPFLFETEYGWLDNTKSEVSGQVIDRCMIYLNHLDSQKYPETVIDISNYIFYFDPLNEDALMYKCKSLILQKRHTLANNTYVKFAKDYRDIYGEEFAKSLHDIIS